MKTLLLLDGSSYLYRAYHALPDLRTAAGEPTGALRGFISMLRTLRQRFGREEKAAFATGLDYLVAVLPNTPGTRGIVDAAMLDALPPDAVVVNAGRGDTLDTAALVRALAGKRLAAAVLDVFEEEPLPAEHVLWRTPGVFITSHTAAPSFPADIVGVFAHNYRRYVRGEPLDYQVDFERGY